MQVDTVPVGRQGRPFERKDQYDPFPAEVAIKPKRYRGPRKSDDAPRHNYGMTEEEIREYKRRKRGLS